MPKTLRVIAVDGARVPHRDELGRVEPGRYVGRNAADEPCPEDVPDSIGVRRALHRGDLVLTTDAPPDAAPAPNAPRLALASVVATPAPATPPSPLPHPEP